MEFTRNQSALLCSMCECLHLELLRKTVLVEDDSLVFKAFWIFCPGSPKDFHLLSSFYNPWVQ